MSKNASKNTGLLVLLLSVAILGAESTWLLERDCNGTAVAQWGLYLNGECNNSDFGNPGFGTCSSSTFTTYDCHGSGQCSSASCTATNVMPLDICSKDNNYYTCSAADPDYSVFGSSYAIAETYASNDCSGTSRGIVAGTLNKCLNAPLNTGPFLSLYIKCSKDGVAQLTFYLQPDCKQPDDTPLQVNTNTCVKSQVYPPFTVSCYGV